MRRLLMFLCIAASVMQAQSAESLDWHTVLGWMPTDTETLVAATERFNVPSVKEKGGPSPEEDVGSPLDLLRSLALSRLPDFPEVYEPLVGRKVQFALGSLRAVRGFSGLGLGPYDGCAVVVFSEPLGSSLRAVFSQATSKVISGFAVHSFSTERAGSLRDHPQRINLFVTLFAVNVLAVATDEESLRLLLIRHQEPAPGPGALSEIPEWKFVDRTAPAWAVRHYRRVDNSTKNLRAATGQPEGIDPGAVGVVYNSQPRGPSQSAFYLSLNPRAANVALLNWDWKDEGLRCRVRRKSAEAIEVIAATPNSNALGTFLLLLESNLGFLIAI